MPNQQPVDTQGRRSWLDTPSGRFVNFLTGGMLRTGQRIGHAFRDRGVGAGFGQIGRAAVERTVPGSGLVSNYLSSRYGGSRSPRVSSVDTPSSASFGFRDDVGMHRDLAAVDPFAVQPFNRDSRMAQELRRQFGGSEYSDGTSRGAPVRQGPTRGYGESVSRGVGSRGRGESTPGGYGFSDVASGVESGLAADQQVIQAVLGRYGQQLR